jgi:trimeric autotransporter adhesin
MACVGLAMAALCDPLLAGATQRSVGETHRADPLLSVDMNRSEIITRLMTQWQGEIGVNQRDNLRSKLNALRADRLLAASLLGSFDGVLELLATQEQLSLANSERSKVLGSAALDLVYTPVTPCRILDTRSAGGAIGAGLSRDFNAVVSSGGNFSAQGGSSTDCGMVAAGQAAVAINVTAVTPNFAGFATVYPFGTARPLASSVNYTTGAIVNNTVLAKLPSPLTTKDFTIFTFATSDFVADIVGYFAPPPQPIGTVSSITAGSGLTGGTITTSGTVAVNTAVIQSRVSASCAVGSSIRAIAADGTVTCQTDANSGGTVTNVATGTGLTGGPVSTTGTLSIASSFRLPQACDPTQIAKWNGSAWICAADDAGPANAFVQGGNAFAAPAVVGTTDAQPVTVRSGGGTLNLFVSQENDGLRIVAAANSTERSPNVINGSSGNSVGVGVRGATIAGGGNVNTFNPAFSDPNRANGNYSTIGGGAGNVVTDGATIAGGQRNSADQSSAVGGGGGNNAAGTKSTIAGGGLNSAIGAFATVAGGESNLAGGDYSFAAGRRARGNYNGAFMWADSTNLDFKVAGSEVSGGWANAVNTFNVRATGGVWFVTAVNGTGVPTAGPFVSAGSGTWAATSDRAAKTAITPINAQAILRKVAALPISSWQYLSETGVRHIGPMSQDFKRLFAVGPDERSITTIDADGVALAAIQGLNQVVQKKDAEIAALKKRLAAIEKRLGIQ